MSTELFDREAAEEGRAGAFEYISASRLNCWLRCPLAFKLPYIDGIRSPPSPALFVGKRVHAALERFYRNRQFDVTMAPDRLQQWLAESWGDAAAAEGVAFETSADEDAHRGQAVALIKAYLEKIPQTEPKPLAVESSIDAPLIDLFTGENLGIPLIGVVDLVLPEAVGPVIVDFKTAAKSGPPLEISHEIQLSCYAYLFRPLSPVDEAGLEIRSLVKTKTPQIQFHRYPARSERHFRRLFAVIRAYLDDLHSDRFVFRPSWGCASCEFCDGPCKGWAGA
jgi:putative RecB family exonuclease